MYRLHRVAIIFFFLIERVIQNYKHEKKNNISNLDADDEAITFGKIRMAHFKKPSFYKLCLLQIRVRSTILLFTITLVEV